jgi:hypothetical protein
MPLVIASVVVMLSSIEQLPINTVLSQDNENVENWLFRRILQADCVTLSDL